VIDRLESLSGDSSAVVFVYIDYKDPATQSVANILANFLKQLLEKFEATPLPLDLCQSLNQIQSKLRSNHVELREYVKLIRCAAKYFVSVYFVIDALDECDSSSFRRSFVASMKDVVDDISNVKLLITSRRHISIGNVFNQIEEIELRASPSDLRAYALVKLGTYAHISESLKAKILHELLSKTDGTY
jgi:hypothetical protein